MPEVVGAIVSTYNIITQLNTCYFVFYFKITFLCFELYGDLTGVRQNIFKLFCEECLHCINIDLRTHLENTLLLSKHSPAENKH